MRKATTKRAAAKPKKAEAAATEPTNNGVQVAAPAPAPKAPAKKPAARKPAARKPAAKKAAKPAAKAPRTATAKPKAKAAAKPKATRAAKPKAAVKKPAAVKRATPAKGGAPKVAKAKIVRKKGTSKRRTKFDSNTMVLEAVTTLKGLEKTARKLLTEIHRREAEIGKLKLHIVDLNGQLKRAKQGNKRQERAAERALLRAHATVKRHATKAAAASSAAKAAPKKKVPSFTKVLDKHAKKAAPKKISHHKHAAAHAKHKVLAAKGHEVVAAIKHHL